MPPRQVRYQAAPRPDYSAIHGRRAIYRTCPNVVKWMLRRCHLAKTTLKRIDQDKSTAVERTHNQHPHDVPSRRCQGSSLVIFRGTSTARITSRYPEDSSARETAETSWAYRAQQRKVGATVHDHSSKHVADVSVVTVVHDREEELRSLIQMLGKSETLPKELVVVHMNESPYTLNCESGLPFTIHHIDIHSASGKLPLARARNAGRAASSSSMLFFTNADCLLAADTIAGITAIVVDVGGIVVGSTHHTENTAGGTRCIDHLCCCATRDPSLPELGPDEVHRPLDAELFSCAAFACEASVFDEIGGFDESFVGYGAEDVDFAFAACAQDVAVRLTKFMTFHQRHRHLRTGMDEFEDIVRNAQQFRMKWGVWTLQPWLEQFRDAGLIDWSSSEPNLRIVRWPTVREVAETPGSLSDDPSKPNVTRSFSR